MPGTATAIVRVRQRGKSLVVTLPEELEAQCGLRVQELVRITVERVRRNYFGAFRGVGTFAHEERKDRIP